MSLSGTKWQLLVEKVAEYDENVEGQAFFEKAISVWREYPNAISNRVSTVVEVHRDSDLWKEVMAAFDSLYHFDARECRELTVMKFIPKDVRVYPFSENAYEVSYFEEELLVRFYPLVLDGVKHPHFESPYSIGCRIPSSSSIQLQFLKSVGADESHFVYMTSKAFDTMFTWLKGIDLSKSTRKTNALIDKESYHRVYRHLREDFGRPLIKLWTENSDPQKTIFEDCGIVAYINELVYCDLLPKPKKYVDIGCGNGLLVHLLNKHGFSGYGVDVRKRKVWSSLFKDDDLRESAVEPQMIVDNLPHFDPDVDLLIGNHSDELTPWIPVMAAKLNCNFFLLPCCPFNFFGRYTENRSFMGNRKFTSQYESFFEWTASVAQRLGFDVKIDRLAIPSTKRLCIVGRVPEGGLAPDMNATIELMTGGQKFVARPQAIKISNCQNIPFPDRQRMALQVFQYVLNASEERRDGWRCGGEVPLSELAKLLTDEDKKMMKDQDGGLQTFLKNNHQIFHVVKSIVRLRDQRQPKTSRPRPNWKPKTVSGTKSSCWMALNHPDGCPMGPDSCRFSH